MASIKEKYGHIAKLMMENSRHPDRITHDTLYQESNIKNRELVEQVLNDLLLPGSDIVGYGRLQELFARAQAGQSGLVLMEHFSNFDIPGLDYLLRSKGSEGAHIADSIVSLAGMKLNEENRFVQAFTEGYTRIVIYPKRSLDRITDSAERVQEERKAKEINHSALREMIRCKHSGKLILVFPTGTRYRPGDPDTKRVLRTVDSYIKSFDSLVFIGIAGNLLVPSESGDMTEDRVEQDVMSYYVSEPLDCKQYRERVRSAAGSGPDPKQFVADRVGEELERAHEAAEQHRAAVLGRQQS